MKLYSFFMKLDFKLQIALVKINKGLLKFRFWNQEPDITNKSSQKELKIIEKYCSKKSATKCMGARSLTSHCSILSGFKINVL